MITFTVKKRKGKSWGFYLCEATSHQLSVPGGRRGSGIGPHMDSRFSGMTARAYCPALRESKTGPSFTGLRASLKEICTVQKE